MALVINGDSLSLEKIERFIKQNQKVVLSSESKKKIKSARILIDKWVKSGKAIYGVTTGFGEFANVSISEKDTATLQRNLIVSHSAGVGENLPPLIVKIMMLLRANALAKGNSGIRLETIEHLLAMINSNIIPVIPSQGSVGSSGDLAPLSHLVLSMIGEGDVQIVKDVLSDKAANTKIISSKSAFKKYKLTSVVLGAKEGLALINGT